MSNSIDATLIEAIAKSTCFGLAYDISVPECKQCDVKGSCKTRMLGGLGGTPIPTTKAVAIEPKKESKPATKAPTKKTTTPTTKKDKPSKPASTHVPTNLPDFKSMSMEELEDLAKKREVEWKDYNSPNITRMRLIMALKKSY